jgi:hypothetical protein
MSYFDRIGNGGLGCGRDCPCSACQKAAHRLGETYERDDEDDDAPQGPMAGFAERPAPSAPAFRRAWSP